MVHQVPWGQLLGLTLVMLSISFQTCEASMTNETFVECYYCGPERTCPFPWDPENVMKIKCKTSCFRFDGYASDGFRTIMRDCGYFETEECALDQKLFGDVSAEGEVCHCQSDLCNSGNVAVISTTLIGLVMASLKTLNYLF